VRGELITRTAALVLCVGPGRRVGTVVGDALSVRIVDFDVVSSGRSSECRCDGCDEGKAASAGGTAHVGAVMPMLENRTLLYAL
jgi:hypothetical protein